MNKETSDEKYRRLLAAFNARADPGEIPEEPYRELTAEIAGWASNYRLFRHDMKAAEQVVVERELNRWLDLYDSLWADALRASEGLAT